MYRNVINFEFDNQQVNISIGLLQITDENIGKKMIIVYILIFTKNYKVNNRFKVYDIPHIV